MSDVSGGNRFAPPRAVVSDLPPIGHGFHLAGRGARLLAVVIDSLLMGPIVMPLFVAVVGDAFFAGAASGPAGTGGSSPSIWTLLLGLAPGYTIAGIIQGWFFYTSGQTIGKKMLGLRIVRSDGSRAGLPRLLFVRAGLTFALAMIPLIGGLIALVDSLLIFRPSRQCLHDQFADTIVVSAASSEDATLAAVRAAAAAYAHSRTRRESA
jgi:uncharacterized RDD family membrane protein YckC